MFNRKKRRIAELEAENRLIRKMLKIAIDELVGDGDVVSSTAYELKLAWISRLASDDPSEWRARRCSSCGYYMNNEKHKQLFGRGGSTARDGVCFLKSENVNRTFKACTDHTYTPTPHQKEE